MVHQDSWPSQSPHCVPSRRGVDPTVLLVSTPILCLLSHEAAVCPRGGVSGDTWSVLSASVSASGLFQPRGSTSYSNTGPSSPQRAHRESGSGRPSSPQKTRAQRGWASGTLPPSAVLAGPGGSPHSGQRPGAEQPGPDAVPAGDQALRRHRGRPGGSSVAPAGLSVGAGGRGEYFRFGQTVSQWLPGGTQGSVQGMVGRWWGYFHVKWWFRVHEAALQEKMRAVCCHPQAPLPSREVSSVSGTLGPAPLPCCEFRQSLPGRPIAQCGPR